MARRAPDPGFFVGYLNAVPRPLVYFSIVIAVALIGGMAGLAFALSSRTNDPGDAFFATNLGPQSFRGVLIEKPYPILRVQPDADHTAPRTIMLTVPGKFSVQGRAGDLFGTLVDTRGFLFKRGSLDMLQIQGKNGLKAVEPEADGAQPAFRPAPAESLGRWRLTGEICDGKCYAGAMRPGDGLAHKACANLCITSGAPPVFVVEDAGAVEGTTFFLMADENGGPLPDAFRDYVAVRVALEGEIVRLDDLLVFKVDVDQAEVF